MPRRSRSRQSAPRLPLQVSLPHQRARRGLSLNLSPLWELLGLLERTPRSPGVPGRWPETLPSCFSLTVSWDCSSWCSPRPLLGGERACSRGALFCAISKDRTLRQNQHFRDYHVAFARAHVRAELWNTIFFFPQHVIPSKVWFILV